MLSSRWNQVKDPEARESLRLIEQAINQGFSALGVDPLPSQQNLTALGGRPISAPQPPLALAVSSVSGGVLVQITANPANIQPVNYFVETSTSASFTNVTVYRFGLLQTDTINVGTATLFYRCRCQYFSSAFSSYTLFGNPTAVTGGSSALGSTTGSGAVVLQTSPTIITPTISGDETVTGNLLLGGIIKNQAGSVSSGWTEKTGTGNGVDYTTASTTYVDVDSTNLSLTVTIPTGWKLAVVAAGSATTQTAAVFVLFSINDSISGNVREVGFNIATTGQFLPFFVGKVITGDGNSHTVKLQYRTTNGADTAQVRNGDATASEVPTMLFHLFPSN